MRTCIYLFIFLLAVSNASSQTIVDYLTRVELGVGRGSLHLQRPTQLNEDPHSSARVVEHEGFGLSVGFNWPLLRFADDFGLGLSASWRLLFSTPGDTTENPMENYLFTPLFYEDVPPGHKSHFNIPIYALLKYGTDATWGWRTPLGVGLGGGAQFVYHDPGKEYWAPIVAAEVSYAPSFVPIVAKLQYHTEISRSNYHEDLRGYTAQSWSVFLLFAGRFGPDMKVQGSEGPKVQGVGE